ncbi:CCA tRNA nucleotidyltransferase [Saccharibacillus kuerlensis]|uniref:CCA-adding enzyme n=1 Tax=Saccharibacillus kuerlensis TaxID=459527 RepID=A0ABQ2L6Y8_9BACL|nr:CCA tRNA nucleotidyltransferase [Saccharibacillus kuerlensis]GGO04253.1 CCA-adding enzyme [Saccharibacillus kuerlensis]
MEHLTQWKHADPEQVRLSADILRTLEEAGHTACWVGGCVRDELIGRPVNDMDIATSAHPEEVDALFPRTIPTGIEHGTVTVVMEKIPFEVTTFRTESDYKDFRRPEEVTFVRSLQEDLRRRDFTMNAIARGLDGKYVDPYDGRGDLERGLIRCVGEARERFREDALRMLRGVRFASVFGYELEPKTWEALLELRGNMRHIAAERIRAELEKMLGGPKPAEGLLLLARSGLLAEAKIRLTPQALESARPEQLDVLPPKPAELRWAALLQGIGVSGDEAENLLKSWTFSGGFAKSAAALLRIDARMNAAGFSTEVAAEEKNLRLAFVRCVLDFGRTAAENWRVYHSMMDKADGKSTACFQLTADWMAAIPAESPRELALGGKDIVERLDRKPGPWLGDLIRRLLEATAMGSIANEREALLENLVRIEEVPGAQKEEKSE